MMLRRFLSTGIALATVTGLCSAQDGAGVPERAGVASGAGAPRALGGQALTLLDQGRAPRRLLRWNLVEGQRETHRSVVNLVSRTTVDGRAYPPITDPGTLTEGEFVVEKAVGSGEFTIGFTYGGAEGAGGLSGSYRMDDRGRVRGVEFHPTTPGNPAVGAQDVERVEQLVRRMQVLLPEPAVGVGARWSAGSTLKVGGVTLEQVTTVTVDAIDGDRVELIVESKVIDDTERAVDMFGLPAGARATVRATVQKGSGRHTIELDRIGPVSVESESEMIQVFRVAVEDEVLDVTTRTTMGLAARAELARGELASVLDDEED